MPLKASVAKIQQHVGELAQRDPRHCFKRLYRVLCDEAWLTEAWKRIRSHKGSKTAGVDGQTRDHVDETLIKRLADKLRKEAYQPTPVRRVYIPKTNGKRRPLGIPTIQDRIVQSALKMLLEPIYEQDFRTCSHGFRPRRSCITALRDVANRFQRSTWIIEGDITGCYDNIHHGRLLSLLRRRIRDEKLLRLINAFLKAGHLEQWRFQSTYSGTPQGGIMSPLLANIYLAELDKFMEDTLKTNPERESKKEMNARRTKEYRQIENRITRLRKRLKEVSAQGKGEIIKELKEGEKELRKTPSLKTRPVKGYVRYADDYLITLQQHSKAEAEEVKEKIGIFLRTHLYLEQSREKTLITHPSETVKFLGYNLRSNGGRRKGLRLEIPKEAKDELLTEVEKLCKLHHINETDLILKVNEKVRGWMNYYKFASAPQRTFSDIRAKVFWQVSHYLAAKHETSMPTIMQTYVKSISKNGQTRKTIRKWVKGKAVDLWTFPPKTENIRNAGIGQPQIDEKAKTVHEWVKGRSVEKRMEALEEANYQCQGCGTSENLKAHHKGGLRGYRGIKSLQRAGAAKELIILCDKCHLKIGHNGSFAPKNQGRKAA